MKKKKTDENYIEATLTSNRYSRNMEIKGVYPIEQIRAMKQNIGRDYVMMSRNCAFNLKYFDAIIFTKGKGIAEHE